MMLNILAYPREGLSILACVFGLLAFGVGAYDYFREKAVVPFSDKISDTPQPAPVHPFPESGIKSAVAADPFNPRRTKPNIAYRLNPAVVVTHAPSESVAASIPALTLIGTTVTAKGGHIIIAAAGQPPTVMRAGDTIHGFTVRNIGRGRVNLVSRDTTLSLELPKTRVR